MIYRRSRRFKLAYESLPPHIQNKTVKVFLLFRDNPRHPSLRIKKIQGVANVWEGRIDLAYRFTFHYDTDKSGESVCVFRNIGAHSILDDAP